MSDEASVAYSAGTKIGRFRWMICTLLFFAATVNYIDRQVIGILKPTLASEFGWTELDYSWIVFSFQTAYAIGLLFVGKLMDRIGTKIGFAIAIVICRFARCCSIGRRDRVGVQCDQLGLWCGTMDIHAFGFGRGIHGRQVPARDR
jgi:MFS family permease